MNKKTENLLYFRVSDCFDSLKLAIQTFGDYLKSESAAASPEYYKARNYLRDGEKFYQEALKEAKRLLGPLPPHSGVEVEKWRTEFLEQNKILASSRELEEMKAEITNDEYLKQWMSADDIVRHLAKDFEAQRTGKRKLANIKVRILLDKLAELLAEAKDFNKKAMDKFKTAG
jgi:hypothetical protein